MDRRTVLTGTSLSIGMLVAGCLGELPRGDEDSTPDPEENIMVRLDNGTDRTETVSVGITREGEPFLDTEKTVAADALAYIYPDIGERGEYELTATVDATRTATVTFHIQSYDLQMGSNLIVWISADSVEIGIEE